VRFCSSIPPLSFKGKSKSFATGGGGGGVGRFRFSSGLELARTSDENPWSDPSVPVVVDVSVPDPT